MISSKKRQLVMVLIIASICTPVLGTEPNEVKTELKFEISTVRVGYSGVGTIKPTHVARLFINYIPSLPHFSNPEEMKMIFETSAGQVLSQKQRDFLMSSKSSRYGSSRECPPGYHYFCALYAVSEDDARKMPQAFLEAWTNKVNSRLKDLLDEQQELEEKIPKAKKKFEEKLTGLQTSWDKLREKFKGGPHSLKDYNEPVLGLEVVNEAEETIKEMYKKLDALNVEIEGIKAKLLAIEEYKAKKNVGTNILAKLEEILCEQTIELAGASARKKAALEILMREEEFYNLNKKCEKAAYEADKLRDVVDRYEHMLWVAKEKLANPTPDMLLPQVFQNKVTIYPVLVEE